MTKKLNSFKNIITVLMALLLLGIAVGPASAGANLISNLSATNQTSIAVYQPITGDHVNETYIKKQNVTLNITIQLEAVNIGNETNGGIRPALDNLTINFSGTGITFANTSVNTLRMNETNFLATTFINNAADTGFNTTFTNMTISGSIISFNRTSTLDFNQSFGINTSANGANFLHVNISNLIMPSTSASPSNISISISGYNGSIGVGDNTTYVFLRVNPDATVPTIPLANLTYNNLTSGLSIFDSSSKIVNVTDNATKIPIRFYVNDTGTSSVNASGINITSINVVIDAGTTSALQLMVNGTVNTAAITTGIRNASVNLTDVNWAGFGNLTAGNSTTGTSHTLTIAVKDNSTNAATNQTKTFYVPRLILGANKTSDITADGAQLVKITAHLLAPTGDKSPIISNVQFSSDSGVIFNPSTVALDGLGNASTLVKFSTSGTHTIHALVDNAQQDIVITTVAAVTSAKMGIKSDMSVTSASIVANSSDTTILTIQATDTSGSAVARSGKNVTVWETNGNSVSVTALTGQTTANGQFNVTLTSNSTSGVSLTFNAQIEADNGTTVTSQNTVSVSFNAGPARRMGVNATTNGTGQTLSVITATPMVGMTDRSPNGNASITNLVAGNTTTISVNVTDDAAHVLSASTVNFALSGIGSLSTPSGTGSCTTTTSCTATTNTTGFATILFTSSTTAGINVSTINISSADNASLFTNIFVNTTNASVYKIVLSANRTGLATGTKAMLNASLYDVNDNMVNISGVNVTFSVTSGSGTLYPTWALTGSNGTATVLYTAPSSAGSAVIEANSTTLILPGSTGNKTNITMTIGTPDGFTLSLNKTNMPTTANASQGAPIVATVQLTSGGSPIGSSNVNITFLVTSGSIFQVGNLTNNGTSITVKTNGSGIAQVQVNGSGTVETATLTASNIDDTTLATQTADITFTGTATTFTLTNGTIALPDSLGRRNTTVTVQLKDSAGNNVGSANSVTLVVSGGSLTASSGTTNATTGQLNVTLSGTTTSGAVSPIVSAYISGMSPTSKALTVSMSQPSLAVAPNVTSVTVGTATPVLFTATTDSTKLSGVTVTLSGAGTSGSDTTDANGNVTLSVNATSAATVTATASKTGYASGTTTITAQAAPVLTPALVSAITPNSRNAQIGTPVTLFMSVQNYGNGTATGVSIGQETTLAATVSYQQWNGTALIGSADTPLDIAAGATADFVLTINATSAFSSSPMTFSVSSTNGATAPISAVNTLTISANATPSADVIMISTNLNVSTPVNNGTFFALATMNVGGASATGVSLVVEVPTSITGLAYQVNQTNATTGDIIGPATGLTIAVNAQPTFGVWLTPTQAITFDPTNNRITLKLVDVNGKVIGAQSVAVSTT